MALDPKKKGHLLMVALGKGPKPAPKSEPDDDDEDGLDYGSDDHDGDEPDADDGDVDEGGDDDAIQCAHDLINAVQSGDAQGVVEAIKAIVGK